jgi:hypothetical protein
VIFICFYKALRLARRSSTHTELVDDPIHSLLSMDELLDLIAHASSRNTAGNDSDAAEDGDVERKPGVPRTEDLADAGRECFILLFPTRGDHQIVANPANTTDLLDELEGS